MTVVTAIEFGQLHDSCPEALKMRIALGPGATQADWWLVCPRGDWLVWQLEQIVSIKTTPR
ncbi:MAG: hypothetical protein DRJ03_11640 [Chloroflexi bacterium]|nr:MAG: hypothetical protein DRJ03_11640 [Chloroflexota bacterium]